MRRLFNRLAYRRARKQAGENEVVCATTDTNGKPIYFTMPATATDEEVRDAAFAARHGRPMSQVEKTLLKLAEERNATD